MTTGETAGPPASGGASWRSFRLEDLVGGLTTFAAMSYIVFANPAILQPMGMSPGAVFIWTALTAGLASLAAARYVNAPTALACGMGLNAFVADYSKVNGAPWPTLLLWCGLVSVVVIFASFVPPKVPWRRKLLRAVPNQIRAAIKSGVGAVLTTVAIKEAMTFEGQAGPVWMLTMAGLGIAIILVIRLCCAWADQGRPADRPRSKRLDLLDSCAFLISIGVLFAPAFLAHAPGAIAATSTDMWVWAQADHPIGQLSWAGLSNSIGFGVAVFFIMLLDIAGSPFDFIEQKYPDRPLSGRDKERMIRRGFAVDSVANLLAPLAGVTPLVYFAENHAGWQARARYGAAAGVVAAGFFVLAALGVILVWLNLPVVELIPRFIVMPTLFFVGLTVIADSFVTPLEPVRGPAGFNFQTADGAAASADGAERRTAIGRTLYFLPAAVTVVVAGASTLDVAIASGIVTYGLIALFPEKYLGVAEPLNAPLALIYLGAAAVLAFSFANAFAKPPGAIPRCESRAHIALSCAAGPIGPGAYQSSDPSSPRCGPGAHPVIACRPGPADPRSRLVGPD
jgi:AGZA family xanthine/uracil permease-like MFS transporter